MKTVTCNFWTVNPRHDGRMDLFIYDTRFPNKVANREHGVILIPAVSVHVSSYVLPRVTVGGRGHYRRFEIRVRKPRQPRAPRVVPPPLPSQPATCEVLA